MVPVYSARLIKPRHKLRGQYVRVFRRSHCCASCCPCSCSSLHGSDTIFPEASIASATGGRPSWAPLCGTNARNSQPVGLNHDLSVCFLSLSRILTDRDRWFPTESA